MSREGMKTRKCGCVVYDYGPPILCEKHASKEKKQEDSEVRQLATKKARILDHELTRFKPYGSTIGKWTAYCRACGAIAIVYDQIPRQGDQIAGKALFETCGGGSAEFAALRELTVVLEGEFDEAP